MSQPGKGATNVNVMQLDGYPEVVNSVSITVLQRDPDGNIFLCQGTTVPTDASSGYAKGCKFIKTDDLSTNSATYENTGSTTSSLFKITGTGKATATITASQIRTMYATPITLVGAPGAGKIIIVDNLSVKYVGNSSPFLLGGALALKYGDMAGNLLINSLSTAQINMGDSGTLTTYSLRKGIDLSTIDSATIENTPVVFGNLTQAFGQGSGTLTVAVTYRVL